MSKPARERLPVEERRRQIVEAALQVIAWHGLGGATIPKVAQQAGVSTGLVILHFESKHKLFIGCLETLTAELWTAWRAAQRPQGRSPQQELLDLIMAHFQTQTPMEISEAVWGAFAGGEAFRKLEEAVTQGFYDERRCVFLTLIETLIADGAYETLNAEIVLRVICALIEGESYEAIFQDEPEVELEGTDLARESHRMICEDFLVLLSALFPKHFNQGGVV